MESACGIPGFGRMAHTENHLTRSMTPAKGRPTPTRAEALPVRRNTATLQWVVLGVVMLGLVAGLIYVGGDWGSSPAHGGFGGGHGAPNIVERAAFDDRSAPVN
jgi:hypothetical protein